MVRRETPVFGRSEVFEELLGQLFAIRDGGGRLVLLVGDGGVGKSTLLRAAVASSQDRGYVVVAGRALPTDPPEPFALVQDLIRAAQKQRSNRSEDASAASPVLPIFLAPYAGEGLRVSGGADGSTETEEADRLLTHLANPAERVDANRSTLLGRLSDFFLQLAVRDPLLIAVDDLQFADDSSLEFFRQFVPLIDTSRTMILATTTPRGEAPVRTEEALEAIAHLPLSSTLALRPMTEPELAQFVRWLLNGRDPGRESQMRWFTQTEGNPLFAEHLVKGSTGFGAIAPEPGERVGQDFAEILRARIRRLSESEQRLLAYGAVLGHEFDFHSLARACGQDEERLSEGLDRLVHGGILREKGGEVYEFVSERARSDVYAQLTETRRRILHHKAMEAIEHRGTLDSSTLYELARQSYLARDDVKAVEYNRRAAELASQAFAFETAIVFLERAQECVRRLQPRELGTELRLLIELGRFHDEVGDFRRSEELLLDAVARARFESTHETELALALLGLAQTRSDLSLYASARTLATEAFAILQRRGNTRALLAAHRVLGIASWRLGALPEAEHHQREELILAEREGTDTDRGHAMIDLANTFILQGPSRIPEALELYEKAAVVFARGLDHAAHARVLMNRALLHHNAGRMDAGLADMTEALGAAERSHSRIWIGYCALNMAQFRAEQHETVAARRDLERASSLLEPLGDQLAHQQAVMIDGMICEEERNFGAAEEKFGEALRLARELSLGTEISEMCFRLAHLSMAQGDRVGARRRLAQAQEAGLSSLRGDLAPLVTELRREIDRPPA